MVAISTAYTADPSTSCPTGGETRFKARELGSGWSAQVCLFVYLHMHLTAWANFSCLLLVYLPRTEGIPIIIDFFPGRREEDFLALE